jgi:uncharacterized protein HemX
MESEIILSVIGLVSSIATGLIGYANGKRKRENEADKSAYEAYNFALESLRKEFEARIERMQNDYNHIQANYERMRHDCELLQKENRDLREKVARLEGGKS